MPAQPLVAEKPYFATNVAVMCAGAIIPRHAAAGALMIFIHPPDS